jgi:hypothetical protein
MCFNTRVSKLTCSLRYLTTVPKIEVMCPHIGDVRMSVNGESKEHDKQGGHGLNINYKHSERCAEKITENKSKQF